MTILCNFHNVDVRKKTRAVLFYRTYGLVALYVILAGLAIYPVLSVTVPPLVDYPNHLARVHILAAVDDVPALQRNYTAQWHLSTNMAMQAVVSVLAKVMDIYDAGRLFVALSVLLVIAGALALRRISNQKIDAWPVVAFLFLYSHVLFWGFINYYFAGGLYLLGLAAWIGMRNRPQALRLGVSAAIASLIYLCHVVALGMYALSVIGHELWRLRQAPPPDRASLLRDWAVNFGQFLPVIFLVLGSTAGYSSFAVVEETRWVPELMAFSFVSPVVFSGNVTDLVTAVFVLFALGWCWWSPHVRIMPALRWPLALLAIVALLMPSQLAGVWATGIRIPMFLAILLVTGLRFEKEAWRSGRAIAAIAVVLFAWRIGDLAHDWISAETGTSEFRAAFRKVPEGARVLFVQTPDKPRANAPLLAARTYWHIGALGVIDRSVFMPSLFTGHTQVRAAPGTTSIDSPTGTPISPGVLKSSTGDTHRTYRLGDRIDRFNRAYWIGWPRHFEYVVVVRFDRQENPVPGLLRPLIKGSYFDIYRVVPGARNAAP